MLLNICIFPYTPCVLCDSIIAEFQTEYHAAKAYMYSISLLEFTNYFVLSVSQILQNRYLTFMAVVRSVEYSIIDTNTHTRPKQGTEMSFNLIFYYSMIYNMCILAWS